MLISLDIYLSMLRSYRTYEEWKRNYQEGSRLITTSSYRTYEEWKRKKSSNKKRCIS